MSRSVDARYVDPLDHIWLTAAAELGLTVKRSPHGYATTDGQGGLSIAPPEDFDADDCLSQIILHELCHALVQGEDSFKKRDWGLANDGESAQYAGDAVREQACLRVQAALLRRYGLRRLLAPTTDFRLYYDALPRDPMAPLSQLPDGDSSDEDHRTRILATEGLARAARTPFRKPLQQALRATAEVHRALLKAGSTGYDAALATVHPPETTGASVPALWLRAPAPLRHKSGLPMSDGMFTAPAGTTCQSCVYATPPASGRRAGSWRCQRTAAPDGAGLVIDPKATACALHESHLDCQVCGACCRHAYDLVPLGRSEPTVTLHPSLIVHRGKQYSILRDSEKRRCAALAGPTLGPYGCQIYEGRPSTCREFASGTANCLDARRRVGWEA